MFATTLIIANIVLNRDSADMTMDQAPANLPVIYMNVNDEYINPHHGYTVPMEGNYLRGSITPLMANRSISFRADLYDAVIAKVSYEVRPLDMSRLIEDTEVTDFTYDNNEIYATLNLHDLIDDDVEYMLVIKLTTSSGEVIRYYVRVINRSELYIGEKISFVREFSAKTFNKDTAEDIRSYMESNADGDNTSYSYVNIHSSFNQLTWGDLSPKLHTTKQVELLEIDGNTASILLTYQVDINTQIHNVTEFFRVQRGNKRMYLMEYERKMNQLIDENKSVVVNGKIIHGIIQDPVTRIENENGTLYAFVQGNALYSYDENNNTMARLFAFADAQNDDDRTNYDAHGIKALTIDSVGNIYFIVYGYMNRGIHEGECGVAFYYYNCSMNTIEEQFFIPYTKSYQILEAEIDSLAYVNSRNMLFVLLDGTVLSVDINTRQIEVMQTNISEASFSSSEDRSVIAWQTSENAAENKSIEIHKLDTLTTDTIEAPAGSVIMPLEFMDSDLIYGIARSEDITVDDTGRTLIPIYKLVIRGANGNTLKEYGQDGVYILGINKQDNMLVVSRVIKDEETGQLIKIEDDQIMNNKTEASLKNKMRSVVTEDTETTYQTILYKEPPAGNLKLTNPKEVVFEGSRQIEVTYSNLDGRYFVYSKGRLDNILTDAKDAVNNAEENSGVVVDRRMSYVWESANRKSSSMISGLALEETKTANADLPDTTDEQDNEESAEVAEEEISASNEAYAKCLDIILKSRGIYKDIPKELQTKTVMGVLRDNLNATPLELTGCSLSAVLYYVSRQYPVMAMTGAGNAVLIVGYDSKNIYIYDPIEMVTYKKGMNDSEQWFESYGNRFISYIE